MLLLDGEEVLMSLTVCKHYSFTAEGTNLGTTDIEDIAVAGLLG